jgi:hypothetical protein
MAVEGRNFVAVLQFSAILEKDKQHRHAESWPTPASLYHPKRSGLWYCPTSQPTSSLATIAAPQCSPTTGWHSLFHWQTTTLVHGMYLPLCSHLCWTRVCSGLLQYFFFRFGLNPQNPRNAELLAAGEMPIEEPQPRGTGARKLGCEQTRKDDQDRLHPSHQSEQADHTRQNHASQNMRWKP